MKIPPRRRFTGASGVLLLTALTVPLSPGPSAAADGPCASPTIIGTARYDVLVGTEGPDVIDGLGGPDDITGLGGDDILCGGSGSDHLDGGEGNDRLHGQTDALHHDNEYGDVFYDGDTLTGGPGDDLLDPGDDPRGKGSDDALYFLDSLSGVHMDLPAGTVSGEGSDVVLGEFAVVVGSPYDDVLIGTDEDQQLLGGRGSDRIDGGGGDDFVTDYLGDYSDNDPANEGGPPDYGNNVFLGGPGDDSLWAADGDDDLRGGPGDDTLTDDSGVNRLRGGPGRDWCSTSMSGAPGELASGGPGHDKLGPYFKAPDDSGLRDAVIRMDLGAGTASARSGTTVVHVLVPGFESITANSGNRWFIRGTAGPNVFQTYGQIAFVARGLGGSDTFYGSDRRDAFHGGSGHDVAIRSSGPDRYVSVEKLRLR